MTTPDPHGLGPVVGSGGPVVSAQNSRGEWVPAIPLPYYLPLGVMRCECGRKFGPRMGASERYRGHYALVHILGMS